MSTYSVSKICLRVYFECVYLMSIGLQVALSDFLHTQKENWITISFNNKNVPHATIDI